MNITLTTLDKLPMQYGAWTTTTSDCEKLKAMAAANQATAINNIARAINNVAIAVTNLAERSTPNPKTSDDAATVLVELLSGVKRAMEEFKAKP